MFDSSPLSTQPGRILIVDDDAGLRHLAVSVLGAEGHSCWEARDGKTALELLHQIPCDLVLLDLVMPGMDGLAFLHAIHALPRKPLVLVLTGLADIAQILEVFKAGIYDILTKPILPARLCTVVKRGLEYQQLLAQNEYLLRQAQHPPTYADLVGRSPLMLGVFHSIAQAAPTHASILILGETGTGKEKVARAIHDRSLRAEKCFSVIDCTSIPSERMESTLFGYGQGVCSGGDAAPGGLIALSNGGTVFFDEVSHMPLSLQEKLVALLQTHVFQPVGEVQSMPVDVRVLAASSCNLEDEVAAGRFREDLYQQLNMVSIALPPLRERGEDTTLLAY
ncbi:TPA: hypothetical protein DDW35_00620, partial [Candidatus Sumerlaeota bacterium]|nr:hypothetical protein [Candidatus Sumerlaeota bacterium]